MSYHFDWVPIWAHRDLLLSGFVLTVAVSAAALARIVAATIVETTRNVPLLIHMYFWYIGLAFLRLPPFLCAVLGLAIYSAAYVGEIVRGGIDAVARGQSQAALATGLTRAQSLRFVVYPQALRIIAPSLAGLFSQLIKDSSLASVITVTELSFAASAIESDTFRSFEVYITISAFYIVLVLAASHLVLLLPGTHRSDLTVRVADA